MKPSFTEDIDGNQYPDPLTINYQGVIDNCSSYPPGFTLTAVDLKRLWVRYYKETGKTEMDDVLYSVNGIEHVGVLEPGDVIYKYPVNTIQPFNFVNLAVSKTN